MGFWDLTFLEEGALTRRDSTVLYAIERLADVKGDPLDAIRNYVERLELDTTRKDGDYRRRSAGDILRGRYVTGCTDRALVFIALARELKMPTAFVQFFDEECLLGPVDKVRGHVYTDVMDGVWTPYDPVKGCVWECDGLRTIDGRRLVEVARGVGPDELYVRGRDNPIPLLTPRDIMKLAGELREGRK